MHASDDELITEEFTPTSVDKMIVDNVQALGDLTQNVQSNLRHAARIPINLYMGWRKEWMQKARDTYDWKTYLAMKLNSTDFKRLRIQGKTL